ncbi:hypothetical protein SGGMMB4_05801 (plasmid) [Sodalis glossinidius str. 'morsitans']|uniref:Uncharacterized protein n=1 Tax=Sodalis glossinidius (strain morsitans) TaxID=343509 RepID=A0A193QNW3_SODGM|nr:hypothetical protein SGGMMB4_05801 [Sodalis glossinidius str. 'morsitans']
MRSSNARSFCGGQAWRWPLPPLAGGVTPEGEPMPSAFPPAPGGAVPPPTVDVLPIPVPGQLYRKLLRPPVGESHKSKYPYIPTGSFAKSILI